MPHSRKLKKGNRPPLPGGPGSAGVCKLKVTFLLSRARKQAVLRVSSPWLLAVRWLAVAAVAASIGLDGCQWRSPNHSAARVIVLGIDGMDPQFLERHWNDLPNLDRLRREGDFKRLGTTMPPQSPVAWSTFITGLDPAGHGVFDFIQRDPATMQPESSMAQSRQGGRQLNIGPYILPLTAGSVENPRQGTPFWKILGDRGVPVTIIRMPTDFPPLECEGHALAGMGTPDLRGTFGTFTFFTSDEKWAGKAVSGGEIVHLDLENHRGVLRVPGPLNSLRSDNAPTHAEIIAAVDPEEHVARFQTGGRTLILREGEWSEWLPLEFPLVPGLAATDGMIRIFLKQAHPHVAVYVSPVNINPSHPALPISEPRSYSSRLAESVGLFYTQGMPYDTAALRYGVLTRAEYRAHSRQVSEQTVRLLDYGLDGFRGGFLFFHFFGIDQDSHMLWGEHEDELLETYRFADNMVGRVREKAPDAALIVMSDHGFASFDRAVHLNAWLMREGFLALNKDADPGSEQTLSHIDWTRTRAYAVGLNGVYVNQQFRERDGIVAEGEETELTIAELKKRLLQFRDPDNGKPVVHRVAIPAEEFGGEVSEHAPDLVVGYYPGYRASWQTALGEIPGGLVEENEDEWRGDHCIDPEFVPGVFLCNRRVPVANPRLEDVTVTVLAEFGLGKPASSRGRWLFASATGMSRYVQTDN